MTACAYRSLEPVLRERVAHLREKREGDAVLVGIARRVAQRRIGRIVGGTVGVLVGGAALLVGLASFVCSPDPPEETARRAATILLLAAWPAAIAAALVGRVLARLVLADRLELRVRLTGDPAVDLARLEAFDPLREACELAMRCERGSAAMPLAALSLMAPLTIHWLAWFVVSLPRIEDASMADFGVWIAVSALLVGHAHIALLVAAVRWAFSLRARETGMLRAGVHRHWGIALLVAIGVACLPGVVLVGLPPILVGVTGLLFVPFMFVGTARCLERERLALETT